jgi:hypothetical protein
MTNLYGTIISDTIAQPRTLRSDHQIQSTVQSFGGSFSLTLAGEPGSLTLRLSSGQGSTTLTDHDIFRVSLGDALMFTSSHVGDSALGPVTASILRGMMDHLNLVMDKLAKASALLKYVRDTNIAESVGWGDLARPINEAAALITDIEAVREIIITQLKTVIDYHPA